MNWEAIGAIGEVVGAIGVVVTLGYLAVQIRQNSKVVRSSTRQAISTMQSEMSFRVAENPDLLAAAMLLDGEAPADPAEEFRFTLMQRGVYRVYENQYHQHEDGTFDDVVWAGYRENMRQGFTMPGTHRFWKENRARFSTDFVKFVEEHLLGSGDDGDDT